MRNSFLVVLLVCTVSACAQNSSSPSNSQSPSTKSTQAAGSKPNSAAQRPDHIDASSLGDQDGQSSSKDTQIDLSPPPGDDKAHPRSEEVLRDVEGGAGDSDVGEFHPFDPHKAAKDIEVGDFYFKAKKNYRAAENRYREALMYKENDADATFKLAVCLEKESRPDEARTEYENYLKIVPNGPDAPEAKKAIERLKAATANAAK